MPGVRIMNISTVPHHHNPRIGAVLLGHDANTLRLYVRHRRYLAVGVLVLPDFERFQP